MQRKLTTILATDVVGYSRLMGEDEAQTLAALKADRKELIDPKTAKRAVTHQLDGAPTIWRPPPKGVRPWRTRYRALSERGGPLRHVCGDTEFRRTRRGRG